MNRQFKKLRVSLTPECNFSCLYCTGIDESKLSILQPAQPSIPSHQLIDLISKLHKKLDLETVRLTGGEPLLYPQIVDVVHAIRLIGIEDIRLTTNGYLLKNKLVKLKDAGLKSINVSLDGASASAVKKMARRDHFERVVDAIDTAIELGFKVRLNSVIMKGKNDQEIIPLLQFAAQRGIVVRFLELMKMGPLHHTYQQYLFPEQEMLKTIEDEYDFQAMERVVGSTSNYWQLANGQKFGIIANESSPFCADCDRLRIDSQGKVYGCIAAIKGIQLSEKDNEAAIGEKLGLALEQKQPVRFVGHERSMKYIGG